MEFGAPGSVNPDAKVIQMWPKAEDIGINRQVDIGLVSDTRAGLEDLLSAYGKNGTSRDEWVARLRTEKEAELAAFDGILANPPNPIHPFVLVHEVKRYLEEAGQPYSVAGGASDIESWARWLFKPARMGQFIGCGYTGTLGSGFPYAMGMKLGPAGRQRGVLTRRPRLQLPGDGYRYLCPLRPAGGFHHRQRQHHGLHQTRARGVVWTKPLIRNRSRVSKL